MQHQRKPQAAMTGSLQQPHLGEEGLVLGAARGHHVRAPVHLGQLHREDPHPTSTRMYQHTVPRLQVGALQSLQSAVAGNSEE